MLKSNSKLTFVSIEEFFLFTIMFVVTALLGAFFLCEHSRFLLALFVVEGFVWDTDPLLLVL